MNKIGYLNILIDLCSELVIPKGVIDELYFHKEEQLRWELFLSSKKVISLKDYIQIPSWIAGWDLGKGESEVIAFALERPGYSVILDDLQARKCAHTFNVPVVGTVGMILLAKKENHIAEASPIIKLLIEAGLRFDIHWITEVLKLANERF
jgi:predicted nucleic acid-binding protein